MELTLSELRELTRPESDVGGSSAPQGSPIRIVVLQRGWVVVGRYEHRGPTVVVTDGFVVRRWGTDKGLGQLAVEGPRPETVLDRTPRIEVHELAVVCSIDCDPAKWADRCR